MYIETKTSRGTGMAFDGVLQWDGMLESAINKFVDQKLFG
jgi:hypothetical protein